MIPDPRANWIKEGAGGTTKEAHQEQFFFLKWMALDGVFYLPLHHTTCILASQSVVDQQPICWAGQPTETNTQFFIKPQKQHSTMFVLRPKILRHGLSGGGGRQSKKIKKADAPLLP